MLLSSMLIALLFSETAFSQEYFDLYGSETYKVTNDVHEKQSNIQETTQATNSSNTTTRTQVPARNPANVVYHSFLIAVVVSVLLVATGLMIKSFLRRLKRRKFEKEFAMSFLDTSLSSQFLKEQYKPAPAVIDREANDMMQSSRQSFKFPSTSRHVIKTTSSTITTIPPIPSQIILTTPGGDSRKSIWDLDSLDLPTPYEHTPNTCRHSLRRSSSTSSLPSRRGALMSNQEMQDELKALKKKRRKKRWKKLLTQKS